MSEPKLQSNDLFYRFLTFFITTVFSFLCVIQIMPFINNESYIFTGLVIIFSSILYQTLFRMFIKPSSKTIVYIQIIFFWIILVFILCFLLNKKEILYILVPALIIEFILSILFNRILVLKDIFSEQIQTWEGNDLCVNLRNDSLPVETFNKKIDNNKILIYVLSVIGTFLFFTFNKYTDFNKTILFSFCIYTFFMLYLSALFMLFSIYNLYQEYTYYTFLGFKKTLKFSKDVFVKSFFIVFISLLFSLLVSSNKCLIDLPSLLTRERNTTYTNVQNNFQPEYQSYDIDKEALENALGQSKDSPFLEFIVKLISTGFIIGVIFLIIYFLYNYIFTPNFLNFFKNKTIGKIFLNIFQTIKTFFKELFSLKNKSEKPYVTVSATKFKKDIDSFISKSKKSTEKKQELDKLTKQFMKLIDWGSKINALYINTMAPAEYATLLNEKILQSENEEYIKLSRNTVRIGYLYEKALYSYELLSENEQKEFIKLINDFIR